MLAPTHLIFGQTAYLVVCIATGHAADQGEAVAAAAASLIPDIDSRQSYIGRLVAPLATWVEYRFGHRTVTHSLLLQAGVGFVLHQFLPSGWFLALLSGWVSHSVADIMTPAGVAWFWPSRVRVVMPGNPEYRWEAMSTGELAFGIVMVLLTFPLLNWAAPGEGATGLVRQALGRIDSALVRYETEKGTRAWSLDIEGRNNRTHGSVNGVYAVRGEWGDSGFILETDAGPVTACQSSKCDWYTRRAVLMPGKQQETTSFDITTTTATGPELAAHIEHLREFGEVLVLGTFDTLRAKEDLPVVAVGGERVTFHYATPATLRGFRTVRDVQLTVQVRHDPAIRVPDLAALEVHRGRDPRLSKWLN